MSQVVHQSARSSCPVTLLPRDRTVDRAGWRHLWRLSRMIWRETGAAQQEAAVDMMIYGVGYTRVVPQSDRDGKRERLGVRAERIDPLSVFVRGG